MSKNKKSRKNAGDNKTKSLIKRTLTGSFTGTAIFVLMILIFAMINKKTDLSDTLQMIMSFFAICVSAFAGGMISSKQAGEKGLINGLVCGAVQTVLICLLILAVRHDLGLRTLVAWVLTELSGMAGGIIAVNKKSKRKI